MAGTEADRLTRDSILTDVGEKWKREKRVLSPAFHFDHLKTTFPVFVTVAKQLVRVTRLCLRMLFLCILYSPLLSAHIV